MALGKRKEGGVLWGCTAVPSSQGVLPVRVRFRVITCLEPQAGDFLPVLVDQAIAVSAGADAEGDAAITDLEPEQGARPTA